MLALLYCTALETSHSLMLSPRLMRDLWPTCEQVHSAQPGEPNPCNALLAAGQACSTQNTFTYMGVYLQHNSFVRKQKGHVHTCDRLIGCCRVRLHAQVYTLHIPRALPVLWMGSCQTL